MDLTRDGREGEGRGSYSCHPLPISWVLFSALLHPILIDIANKFDSLLINVFADDATYIGRLSQMPQAADMYYKRIHEIISLQLSPPNS